MATKVAPKLSAKEEQRLRAQILELGAILAFHCHPTFLAGCKPVLFSILDTATGWRKTVPRPAWLAEEPENVRERIETSMAEANERFGISRLS